jgi:hypothetical protein
MKMTVITGKNGELVAAAFGHYPPPDVAEHPVVERESLAGLREGPGQKLHLLDVPDELMSISSAAEFHAAVERELRKARK